MSEVASTPELLREDELLSFVRAQRWFGAKSSDVAGLRIADTAVLRSEPHRLLDVLVEVRYGSGTHDLYQLVVGSRGAGDGDGPEIASGDGWRSYEAFADPAFARELLHLLRSGATLPTSDGAIEFCAMGTLPQDSSALREVRPLELEQSNSSIVIDDELIVKLYRRLSAGVNPELELLHFLRSHEFANVPRLEGWWSYVGPLMAASLGVVQRFVPGAIDGWTLALDELRTDPAAFVRRVRRLGEVVGEMHAVLASEPEDQAFAPEEASQESLALLTATVDEEIDDVFLSLPETEAVAPIVGRADAVRDLLRGLSTVGSIGRRIRTHGDLHLGQVLWAAEDWLLIDFEGEPARALPERRLKQSPLRDVAGMLRSFTYATAVAGVADLAIEARAREEFLDGYTHAVQGAAVLPAAETTQRLLRIFELEKAIYELRYELAHRPDWVPVPVNGIVRLLEEEPA
jgi:maltokinase